MPIRQRLSYEYDTLLKISLSTFLKSAKILQQNDRYFARRVSRNHNG